MCLLYSTVTASHTFAYFADPKAQFSYSHSPQDHAFDSLTGEAPAENTIPFMPHARYTVAQRSTYDRERKTGLTNMAVGVP